MTLYQGPQHEARRAKDGVLLTRASLRLLRQSLEGATQRLWVNEALEMTTKLEALVDSIAESIEEKDVRHV